MRDCLTALDDVAPRLGAELDVTADAVTTTAQRDWIVAALTRRLARARTIDPRLPRLTALVAEGRAALTVRAVARETGLGVRRVQQLFRDDVGLSPKQLHRITRFKRALALGRAHARLTWGTIASRAGYSDQAHFIHESREIAGCTPGDLLGGDRPRELTEAFLTRERKRR
jgi:AraC-like DNA-binding protein